MVNLKETEIWEEGIRQLETTDPVVGGEDGVDNIAPRQLANRTLWLKMRTLERMKISTLAEADAYKYIGQVESFAELRKIEPEVQGQRILVKSINAGENRGGGEFYADMTDVVTPDDNQHTVITPNKYRWKRVFEFDSHFYVPAATDLDTEKTYSKFIAVAGNYVTDRLGLKMGDYVGLQMASEGKQVTQLLSGGYGVHYFRVNDNPSDDTWSLERIITDVDMSHKINGEDQNKIASEYAVGELQRFLLAEINSIDLTNVTLSDAAITRLKNQISTMVADEAYAKTQGYIEQESAELRAADVELANIVVNQTALHHGNTSLAYALTDERNRVAMGITNRGDIYQMSATTRNTKYNGWGVTDSQDRLLLGFNTAKASFELPAQSTTWLGSGDFATADKYYKVSEQVLDTGEKYMPAGIISDVGICFLKGGDVYLQKGATTTQITQRGDVVACEMSGNAVRYVAPRRGLYLTYEWRDGVISQVFEPSTLDGYFVTGQSLSVSGDNVATSTTELPNNAYTISTGPMWYTDWNNKINGVIRLKERHKETICTSFGKASLARNPNKPMMVFGSGRGGRAYAALVRGGESGVYEKIITAAKFVQNSSNKTTYRAMLLIHGEADGNAKNADYDKNLSTWLDMYTSDLKAITGQKDEPVLLLCQTAGAAYYKRTLDIRHQFTTPFLQLKASAENPRIFAVTPKYMFNTVDGIHIDGASQQVLGSYYAKVKHLVVDKGEDWLGVRPLSCKQTSDTTIELIFNVPSPPLVLDTETVSDPSNYGFYLYNAGDVAIKSVSLDDSLNKITLTTTGSIPETATVTYAFDNGTGGKSGPIEGARGCLRDSCDELATDGIWQLHNWCFAFEMNIQKQEETK